MGTRATRVSMGVCSLRMSQAKSTVKNGADDLIVSVNDTGTNFRLISPRMTVAHRMNPTSAMRRKNSGVYISELALAFSIPAFSAVAPLASSCCRYDQYTFAPPITHVVVICTTPSTCASTPRLRMNLFMNNVTNDVRYHRPR